MINILDVILHGFILQIMYTMVRLFNRFKSENDGINIT